MPAIRNMKLLSSATGTSIVTCSLLALLLAGVKGWEVNDTVTLEFWSPASDCTSEKFDNRATCSKAAVMAGIVIDNTASTCYMNPTAAFAGDTTKQTVQWFRPGREDEQHMGNEVYAFSKELPSGDLRLPNDCNSVGQCSCATLEDIIIESSLIYPDNSSYGFVFTYNLRAGYSGCATHSVTIPPDDSFATCLPLHGNITITGKSNSSGGSKATFSAAVALLGAVIAAASAGIVLP